MGTGSQQKQIFSLAWPSRAVAFRKKVCVSPEKQNNKSRYFGIQEGCGKQTGSTTTKDIVDYYLLGHWSGIACFTLQHTV